MARVKTRVSIEQRMAGYAVLAVLCALAVWLGVRQASFNPAVIVAMNAPKGKGHVTPGAGAQAATAALFPDVAGYSALGPIETYDPETLSDKIDGKAELYLPAGFKEMSCRSFDLAGAGAAVVHVEVFVYDMDTPPGAFAVFSGQRRPGSDNVALGDNAYATQNALFFTKGSHYMEIVASAAPPELQPALETFATALLAALPTEALEKDESALFPTEGLKADTVRLSASDTFGLEGFNAVYTAEYRLESGEATAFLAARGTPEEAAAQAKTYLAFLTANGYLELPAAGKTEGGGKPTAAATAPDSSGALRLFGLDTSFEVVFVSGRVLAGVHDAASREAALDLAARLSASLASASGEKTP